jgi:hypothetical protein
MWSYRRPRGGQSKAERALRGHRASPRDEFVRSLSERLAEERPRAQTAWSRLAFAGAVSTMILGTFASFGGLGYAASGAASSYSAVKEVIVKHKVAVTVHKSSASAEYPEPPEEQQGAAPEQQTNNAVAAAGVASGTLPFTGYSLLLTVLVGCTLLALGLMLRRGERRDT